MKKIFNFILAATMLLAIMPTTACKSCNDEGNGGVSSETQFGFETERKSEYMESMYLTDYITLPEDEAAVEAFAMEGKDRQGSADTSLAISAYYTTKINGEDAFTYMIPSAETNPHSVVYLDVSEDELAEGKSIKVEVTAAFDVQKAIVLPEKLGVETQLSGRTVSFTVTGYGSYTMIVNDETNPDKAFTIFVRKPEKVQVPFGYTLIEYKPGLHFVDKIRLKSKTVLYLHAGALLVAKAPESASDTEAFIAANGAEDIKIMGHGVIDMSRVPWHGRRAGIRLDNCKNIEVNGVTVLNCSNWTIHFSHCEDLLVQDCVVFGYRINSDGYAVCSTSNAKIVDSFARSGDDLFEIKSYTGSDAENVLFENCVAWPDNCRGFGIIQETETNIRNITYRNCSLLYQLNDWAEHMAAFVVTAGEPGNVSDLLFEDCDLFYCEVFAIRFSIGRNSETFAVGDFNNKIENVTFRNCDFKNPASSRGIMKFRDATPEAGGYSNICFENVTFRGEKLTELSQISPVYEGEAPTSVLIK